MDLHCRVMRIMLGGSSITKAELSTLKMQAGRKKEEFVGAHLCLAFFTFWFRKVTLTKAKSRPRG